MLANSIIDLINDFNAGELKNSSLNFFDDFNKFKTIIIVLILSKLGIFLNNDSTALIIATLFIFSSIDHNFL